MIDIKQLKDHCYDVKDSKGDDMVRIKQSAQAYYDGWVDGSSFVLDLIKRYDVLCDKCNSKPLEAESEVTKCQNAD